MTDSPHKKTKKHTQNKTRKEDVETPYLHVYIHINAVNILFIEQSETNTRGIR